MPGGAESGIDALRPWRGQTFPRPLTLPFGRPGLAWPFLALLTHLLTLLLVKLGTWDCTGLAGR